MARTSTPAEAPPVTPSAQGWLWPVARALLICAIVGAVGWQFGSTLRQPGLWARPLRLHPGWLAAAAALYLLGLAFPAFFWHRLLVSLGQRCRPWAALRAYYIGQLGRYVPGKVVGLAMRARLLAGPGVRTGVAVLSIVYESLTTLASGVLLGLILFGCGGSADDALGWRALALLALLGFLLLPGVFNRLADRTTRRFRAPDAALPQVRGSTLVAGLALTGAGWLVQGGTLWALVEALLPGAWEGPVEAWGRCTAYVALAYAAGFLVLAAPGGLGVRDFLIQQFLVADLARTLGPEEAAGTAVLVALLLRLLWTVLDAGAAAVAYFLPGQRQSAAGQ